MAKVNFERVEARITDQNFGGCHSNEWARCDLALPAGELRAIAGVLDALPWIEQAAEDGGALYIRLSYDKAWLLQERAFHAALAIARRLVAGSLHHLRSDEIPSTPKPQHIQDRPLYYRGAYASLAGNAGSYVMPEGHYGAGFVMVDDEEGRPRGYFLTSDRYDDKKKPLATALLAALFPELGIETWQRLKSYGEVEMLVSRDDIEKYGAAAYVEASALIELARQEVASLQWGGTPSAFLDEDDDARDLLLADVLSGTAISRTRREDADYNDVDGTYIYSLPDGSELPHYIVARLINADVLKPLGWPLSMNRDLDAPAVPLVFYPKVDPAALVGRSECVRFQAFQSYCPQRRRDGDNECAHNLSRSYRCSEETCPIVTQVYVEDGGRWGYGTSFEEEPAFDDANCERDTLVRPIHPNTMRSSAWRSAGVQQVEAVVNQVLHAKYRLGVEGGRFLFGAENDRAVRQAIAEGYLVLEQEMPGFGLVVQASDTLIAEIEVRKLAHENAVATA